MSERQENRTNRCTGRTAAGARCRRAAEDGSTRCPAHGYKPPGRPSKLTDELREQIVFLILEGNYIEVACQACGVGKSTFYRWLQRAEDAIAKAEEHSTDAAAVYDALDIDDWPYVDFRDAIKSAEAFAETELLRRASSGMSGWQAPMTVLERRFGARWRRRDVVEHEGAIAGRFEVVRPDTDDKRLAVATILSNAGALAGAQVETKPARKRAPRKKGPSK